MRAMKIEDLPPSMQAQVRAMDAASKPEPVVDVAPVVSKVEKRDESKLQADCERWLTLHGYRRRTPDDIADCDIHAAGWFIHLQDAKRNPILGDLLIMRRGFYIEIELKAGKAGRLSDEQHTLAEYQWITVCRSLAEFIKVMEAWK